MLKMTRVPGLNKGKIVLYALSTCGWCAKTKKFLNEAGVAYSYIDVDLLSERDSDDVARAIERWNPKISFPTIVINDEDAIVGYNPDSMREMIG